MRSKKLPTAESLLSEKRLNLPAYSKQHTIEALAFRPQQPAESTTASSLPNDFLIVTYFPRVSLQQPLPYPPLGYGAVATGMLRGTNLHYETFYRLCLGLPAPA